MTLKNKTTLLQFNYILINIKSQIKGDEHMTTEEVFIKYICSNCKNTDDTQCEIRTKIDNTTYCYGYINKSSKKRAKISM